MDERMQIEIMRTEDQREAAADFAMKVLTGQPPKLSAGMSANHTHAFSAELVAKMMQSQFDTNVLASTIMMNGPPQNMSFKGDTIKWRQADGQKAS